MARFLVVDDSSFMRNILKNILIKEGHEIIGEASNGEEAISKYVELCPDVVTMDITMDYLNGIDALKNIKEINNNANVVMVSAMGQKVFILDSVKNGAKDFIIKPFKREDVVIAINNIIKDEL